MTFHILLNQITTLFLSLNYLTTLTFESPIENFIYGGVKEKVFMQVSNKQKTLVLKGLAKGHFSNLLVITKKRKYYFDLQLDPLKPHKFIEVRHGLINNSFKSILKQNQFEVLEGTSSYLIVNKGPIVRINNILVKKRAYFSKGVPLIFQNKRILN